MPENASKDIKQESSPKDARTSNQAFEIDGRIWIKIDRELAISLGVLILATDTKNSALLALGHQLRSFCNEVPSSQA